LGIYVNMVAVYQSDFSSLNVKNTMADTLIAAREIFSRDAEVRRLYPKLLQNAADMGDVKAQHAVASIYEKGESVSRDHDAAMRWYEASAFGGLADAQFRLGLRYSRGDVRRPHEKRLAKALAWAWLEMAARRGLADAERAQESLDRTMSADDRFWADILAKMFSESIGER
jgi:TPR repeat protein